MKLCSDILFQNLLEQVTITQMGTPIPTLSLEPPVFWREGMALQTGKSYIGRAEWFPQPAAQTRCLILCVGGHLPTGWSPGGSCVFLAQGQTDLFRMFNLVQDIFGKYETWKEQLDEIVHTTADPAELLRISAPLFGNSLGLCNKHLEIIASVTGKGEPYYAPGKSLSQERVAKFAPSHAKNIAMRTLFPYTIDGITCYCLNIYAQDQYLGLLTLSDDGSPVTPGKLSLYEFFFQYVRKAAISRVEANRGSVVTLKTIFSQLLDGVPLSALPMAQAMEGTQLQGGRWLCLAATPGRAMENIPGEYLCSQLEELLPQCAAFQREGQLVAFLPETACPEPEALEPLVSRLFDWVGISNPFTDLSKAPFYHRQAVIARKMAEEAPCHPVLCRFRDYALTYALKNSLGQLPPEYLLPQGLWELLAADKQEQDYSRRETLKVYLDNEMNATQTARELYIHRTTLQNRLKAIEKLVNLSTAESRLYLRYGLYLWQLFTGD